MFPSFSGESKLCWFQGQESLRILWEFRGRSDLIWRPSSELSEEKIAKRGPFGWGKLKIFSDLSCSKGENHFSGLYICMRLMEMVLGGLPPVLPESYPISSGFWAGLSRSGELHYI